MDQLEFMKEHYMNMFIIISMWQEVGRYIPINELVKYPLEQQCQIIQLFQKVASYPIEEQDAIIEEVRPQLELIKEMKQK